MKSAALWCLLMAGLVVLQAKLSCSIAIGGARPDFFLISVLLVAMRRGGAAVAVWGAAAGLFQDVLSGGIVGFNLLTKPAAGFAVGLLRPKLDFENPNTQSVVALAASLLEGGVLALIVEAHHPAKAAAVTISGFVLPTAVYNAVLLPLLIPSWNMVLHWARLWRRRTARAE